METTWGTHTKPTLTYLVVFLLLEPRELTHLLGFPGVPLSVSICESTEVLGQLEDVTKRSPCATYPVWGTASLRASGWCDGAGAGCGLQGPGEGAGDKRPKVSFSADALPSYHRDENHGCTQWGEDRP